MKMVFTITNEVLMKIRYQIENQKELDKARRDINSISTPYGLRGPEGKFISKGTATAALSNARKQEKADVEAAKAEKLKLAAQQKSNRALYGLLGSMFLLAAISSSIMAMASPAMELAGVFDIIALILTLLFLPAIIYLLPFLLKILKWVSGMSHETKLFIGIALLVIAVFAMIAGATIAVVLAVSMLIPVIAALAGVSAPVAGLILLVVAAIAALIAIFVGLFTVIDDWINRHRNEIYSALGAETPEEQAKMAAGFAGISAAIPDAGTPGGVAAMAISPGLFRAASIVDWLSGKLAGSTSTNNSWSWSSIINILGGRDSNQPKLDGATTNPY
jgi:hypothetical protein